jgi:uncharacterized protein YcfJ
MKTKLLSLALLLAGAPVFAQTSAADYARVQSVTPQTERVPVNRNVCEDRMVQQYAPAAQPSYGGTVLGTIIGGAIGSRFGGGDGRIASTAVGAGLGAIIGNNSDRQQPAPAVVAQAVPVRECHQETTYEQRTRGYLVDYEFEGRHYSATLPKDPGQWLRVNVSVTPAG